MVGGSRRRKTNMLTTATNIGTLPDDAIFDILVRVPAEDICNAAIFVCRTWRRMIRTRVFVHAHLQQSTPGLLVQDHAGIFESTNQPIFLATPKGQIETSNFSCKFTRRVMSSCNGLVLERCDKNNHCRDLYITNPSTKQHSALPSFPCPYEKPQICGLGYAAADMEYKVVGLFLSHYPEKIECTILTVGVDTDWGRRVNTQHLPLKTCRKFLRLQKTLTTQGFVHWTDAMSSDFLSLNVETEVITHFSIPAASRHGDGRRSRFYHYLAMGSSLSLLVGLGHGFGLSWEVWEMRPETGEWTQMPNIDLSKLKSKIIKPVGWSSSREVLLFRVYSSYECQFHVAYNVRTQEIVSTELDLHLGCYFLPHKNTLLWL